MTSIKSCMRPDVNTPEGSTYLVTLQPLSARPLDFESEATHALTGLEMNLYVKKIASQPSDVCDGESGAVGGRVGNLGNQGSTDNFTHLEGV